MRPTLRQLQYLVAVADTGRFGEAAQRLNVSQPSLSAQLADMEDHLGQPLIERGRSGAVLTPLGQDITARARSVLRDMEDLVAAARQGTGTVGGRIRLGVLPSIGPYLLPDAVKRLHALYPDLRLNVYEERPGELDQRLRDARLDTVISAPEDHPDAQALALFEEDLWICVAPDDPLATDQGPVSTGSLKGRPLLSLGYGHQINHLIQDLAARAGAHVSTEYQGTSLDAVRQMAAMGAGVAVLSGLYAQSEARRDPDLIIRRIGDRKARRRIALLWRSTSPLGPSYRALAPVLKSAAEAVLAN